MMGMFAIFITEILFLDINLLLCPLSKNKQHQPQHKISKTKLIIPQLIGSQLTIGANLSTSCLHKQNKYLHMLSTFIMPENMMLPPAPATILSIATFRLVLLSIGSMQKWYGEEVIKPKPTKHHKNLLREAPKSLNK